MTEAHKLCAFGWCCKCIDRHDDERCCAGPHVDHETCATAKAAGPTLESALAENAKLRARITELEDAAEDTNPALRLPDPLAVFREDVNADLGVLDRRLAEVEEFVAEMKKQKEADHG